MRHAIGTAGPRFAPLYCSKRARRPSRPRPAEVLELGLTARRSRAACRSPDKLEQLPTRPGVYLFKGADGTILYVGKARVLRDRVRSYFQASRPTEPHKVRLVEEIADLDLVVTDSEMEALALENNLIKRHRPQYNVRLRDDKNHPYLKLTLAEEYPRLYVVRRPAEDGNAYGGPYIPASLGRRTGGPDAQAVRHPLLQGDAERPPPAPLPAAPDRPLPGALRRGGLLARAVPSLVRGRASVPRGPHGRGAAAVCAPRWSEAASDERYEEAASLRDQVRTLQRMEAPQKITTTEIEERDLLAAHVEGERAALQVWSVRDGKVVAREGFLLDAVTEPELVSGLDRAAVLRLGALRAARGPGADEIPDRELLQAWLEARRGAAVRIRVPQRGEKLRLLELVVAQRAARLRAGVEAPAQAVAGAAARPARRARAGGRAAADRVLRHLQHPGLGHGRLDGRLRGRPAEEVGLPQVPGPRAERERPTTSPRCARWWAGATRVCSRRARSCRIWCWSTAARASSARPSTPSTASAWATRQSPAWPRRRSCCSCAAATSRSRCPARRPCSSSSSASATRPTASRSAITGRPARSRTLRSELDEIPGIGPSRRRKLLSAFGSVRGVRGASPAELAGRRRARDRRAHPCALRAQGDSEGLTAPATGNRLRAEANSLRRSERGGWGCGVHPPD